MARKKKGDAKAAASTPAVPTETRAQAAAAEHAKRTFNLSVLRKHIPAISTLASSASFVVLYVHSEESGSWTKTGIEGPLFLFSIDSSWAQTPAARALASIAPNKAPPPNATHGFVILNRNGLENFAVYITAADDIEITPQFILYRPDVTTANQVPPPAAAEKVGGDDDDDPGTTFAIWVFEEEERHLIGQELEQLHALAANVAPETHSIDPTPTPEPGPASAQTLLDLLFQSVGPAQSTAT
ncbi:hypothetical protein A4X13_0g5051 [Tilletia indica]|uniref:PH domain-like protein n=1 Tax=Tilletia indica TaxID=43049 RepID=A0A177TB10_9BASI|nr:hypothetical protein A4X13_0g5051 [Tilletia indica]